ncbi:hypothetical protein N665_2641s0001 [Sinapis alba]|nr:hypothetical protein N665_2641s0001 [Sinapis alba]
MVNIGIVLGHKVSAAKIEVDKEKIEVMTGFPPSANVKDIRSFLGHGGFYRRFIKDFSKIARPLTALLCKNSAHEEESTVNTLSSSNDYNRKALIDNAFKTDDNITIPIDMNVSCNPSFSINDLPGGRSLSRGCVHLTPLKDLEKRLIQLNELDEIRHHAYEKLKLYKERPKAYHDKKIISRHFDPNNQVLLYNSRLTLFPGKLRSRWCEPFTIKEVTPYGTIILFNLKGEDFMVNGQRVKHYWAEAEISHTQTMRLEMPDPE